MAVSTLIREPGHPIVGGWLGTSSPLVIEACRAAGLDFVTLDTQHSALSLEDCAGLLASQAQGGFSVIVRVDSSDPAKIGKALDLGASGVIVPLVETAEQARRAAQACRFPPLGMRSYGPVRSDIVGLSPSELNERARLFVMIETEVGMRNAAEIAATPGVDGIFVGPADLSISLGLAPQRAFDTAQLETHFRDLRLLADRHGLILGSLGLDVESATRWLEYGCDFVAIVTNERQLIGDAVERLSGALGVSGNVEG